MFSFFKRASKEPIVASINGQEISVESNETVLHAALREQIDFPHSCRVGGCAQCKCKLIDGKVKELTDVGYILSDDELDKDYILACQSVPKTNIKIEVDLSAQANIQKTTGRILEQNKLTHDITQLRIQLTDSVTFKPGQFANIALASMPDALRSYSFASPCDPSGQVSFFVRELPNGRFSSAVNQQDLVNTEIQLEGPMGDFWLRSGTGPIVMIAGGSGLAPIMSMLNQAINEDHKLRDVTLIFGARTQKDLYMIEEIKAVQAAWCGIFNFITVLSEEPEDSGWKGDRGLVTDHVAATISDGFQAYLCGPPGMIDAAENTLKGYGMAQKEIYADRFTTLEPTTKLA